VAGGDAAGDLEVEEGIAGGEVVVAQQAVADRRELGDLTGAEVDAKAEQAVDHTVGMGLPLEDAAVDRAKAFVDAVAEHEAAIVEGGGGTLAGDEFAIEIDGGHGVEAIAPQLPRVVTSGATAPRRWPLLDRRFLDELDALAARPAPPAMDAARLDGPIRPGSRLTARGAIELFDAQAASRHLDFAARALRARNEGFYTIGSSGHEGNAAVAAALRPTDPGFLHYRSGAFFIARARQVPGQTPLLDVLLGLCASSDEPIAGGRHKVF